MAPDPLIPEILPHGQDGLILRLGLTPREETVGAVQTLRSAVEAEAPPGVEEIAVSLTSVFLRFDPARTSRADGRGRRPQPGGGAQGPA